MQSTEENVMEEYYGTQGTVINDFFTQNVALQFTLAKKYISSISDENISLTFNVKSHFYEIYFNDRNSLITIFENSNWSSNKAKIDTILFPSVNLCSICNGEFESGRVKCGDCNIFYCVNCYIDNFRKNKGIIKCISCNFSYGRILSKREIEQRVKTIKMRSGIKV